MADSPLATFISTSSGLSFDIHDYLETVTTVKCFIALTLKLAKYWRHGIAVALCWPFFSWFLSFLGCSTKHLELNTYLIHKFRGQTIIKNLLTYDKCTTPHSNFFPLNEKHVGFFFIQLVDDPSKTSHHRMLPWCVIFSIFGSCCAEQDFKLLSERALALEPFYT